MHKLRYHVSLEQRHTNSNVATAQYKIQQQSQSSTVKHNRALKIFPFDLILRKFRWAPDWGKTYQTLGVWLVHNSKHDVLPKNSQTTKDWCFQRFARME